MANSAIIRTIRRETVGSRSARKLRGQGMIPVHVLAGSGRTAEDLAIDEFQFMTARRKHAHVFDLDFGGSMETVVVRELQWDTLRDRILHVDFRRVERDVETESDVELEFVGMPKSGQVIHVLTHIKIRSLPDAIPDSILVNVDGLEEGSHVKAGDLPLPAGVKLSTPAGAEVAVIAAIRVHVEAPAESAATPAAGAAPATGTPPKA